MKNKKDKNNKVGASEIGSEESVDKYSIENEDGKYDFSNGNTDGELKVNPKDLEEFDDEDKNKNTSRVGMVLGLLKTIKAGFGADLTNVEIPGSFILPRSSLTFFSEVFLNNFDILLNINNKENEVERLLGILKYANTILIEIPDPTRKPLNPILGEQIIGRFQVLKQDGKIEEDNHYCLEQVSHHPPLSVVSVYNKKEGIRIHFTAPLRFYFAGTYFKIPFDGECEIHLDKFNETYKIAMPMLCGRYLRGFTEFVGTSVISSSKSQYYIKSQYHAKPLLGGSYNYFESYLYKGKSIPKDQDVVNSGYGSNGDSKLFKIFGQWTGESKIIDYSINSKESKLFYKRKESSLVKKIEESSPYNSNVVWQGVISAYNQGNMKMVSKEKSKVEIEQRLLAAERKNSNQEWVPKFFKKNEATGKWDFTNYQD